MRGQTQYIQAFLQIIKQTLEDIHREKYALYTPAYDYIYYENIFHICAFAFGWRKMYMH